MDSADRQDARRAKKQRYHEAWTLATENYSQHIEPFFAPLTELMLAKVRGLRVSR